MIRFIACWSILPAVFFSLYPYRIKPYLYILVPALAILVDWGYFRIGRSRSFRLVSIVSGIALFLASAFLAWILRQAELVPVSVYVGLAMAGFIGFVCASKDWMRGFALAGLGVIFFYRITAITLGEADVKQLRESVNTYPNAQIAMLDENRNIWHELGLLSVAIRKPIKRLHSIEEVVGHLDSGGMVILSDGQSESFLKSIESKILERVDQRKLDERPWMRWKVRSKFPFRKLIEKGKAGIPDFEDQLRREFKILRLGA